jgi:hypothetical protein
MIWRIVSKYGELAGARLAVSPGLACAIFEGLSQQALMRHAGGSETAAGGLQANTGRVLEAPVLDG